ncbi:MAG: M56 family peptidase [Chloroflexota bacterium]|nr:MAG: M56 family peptidase [Chloroflexota bacterium]
MLVLTDAARWHMMTGWLAFLGNYWAHAILVSLVSVVVVQGVARVWPTRSSNLSSRLAFLSVVLPPLAMAFYEIGFGGDSGLRQQVPLLRPNGWLYLTSGKFVWVVWVVVPLALLTVVPFAYEGVAGFIGPRRQRWKPTVDVELRSRGSAASQSVGTAVGFSPRLMVVCRGEPVASVSGLLRPTIMLSEQLIRILDQEELEAVIAHECAHIKRHDTWVGYLAFLARALLLFNPAVTWAYWQMSVHAERSCDRWAAERTGLHLALGSALLKIDRAANGRAPNLAEVVEDVRLSVRLWEGTARRTLLRERVERLLHDCSSDSAGTVLPALTVAAAIVLVVLFFIG